MFSEEFNSIQIFIECFVRIDKEITAKCMELWDIMFERRINSVEEISRKLMER